MKTAFLTRADCIGMDIFDLEKFLAQEHGFNPDKKISIIRLTTGIQFTQED